MIDWLTYRSSPNYRHGYEDGFWAGIISGTFLCVVITVLVKAFS